MKSFLFLFLVNILPTFGFSQPPNANGYWYKSVEEVEKYVRYYADILDLHPGQKVVSVGAANGWAELALGLLADSIIFYIEDIDSTLCNQREINKGIEWYTKVKGRPLTCSYIPFIGTDTSTNLPPVSFDKILLQNLFHHFTFALKMFDNFRSLLKAGGKIYLTEHVLEKRKHTSTGLVYDTLFTEKEILDFVQSFGFTWIETIKPFKDDIRIFIFEAPGY